MKNKYKKSEESNEFEINIRIDSLFMFLIYYQFTMREKHPRTQITWYAIYTGILNKKTKPGNSLASQWLGMCASTAGAMGQISGQGSKTL